MSPSGKSRFLLAVGVSALLTWGTNLVWNQHSSRTQIEFALKLAQQVAAQVESGPTRLWTLQSLSLGAESRPVRVSPLRFVPNLPESEYYRLNSDSGSFTYYRILDRQKNEGVRVTVQLPYPGFLGFQTKAAGDLATLVVFGFILILVSSAFSPGKESQPQTMPQPQQQETEPQADSGQELVNAAHLKAINELKDKIALWAKGAKKLLVEMTSNLKLLTKSVQSVLGSAIKTIEQVENAGQESSAIIESALELEASLATGAEDLQKARRHLAQIKKSAELTNQSAAAALEAFGPLAERSKALTSILLALSDTIRTESDRIRDLRKHVLDPGLTLLPPIADSPAAPPAEASSPPEESSVEPPGEEPLPSDPASTAEPASELASSLTHPPTDEELSAMTENSLASITEITELLPESSDHTDPTHDESQEKAA